MLYLIWWHYLIYTHRGSWILDFLLLIFALQFRLWPHCPSCWCRELLCLGAEGGKLLMGHFWVIHQIDTEHPAWAGSVLALGTFWATKPAALCPRGVRSLVHRVCFSPVMLGGQRRGRKGLGQERLEGLHGEDGGSESGSWKTCRTLGVVGEFWRKEQ